MLYSFITFLPKTDSAFVVINLDALSWHPSQHQHHTHKPTKQLWTTGSCSLSSISICKPLPEQWLNIFVSNCPISSAMTAHWLTAVWRWINDGHLSLTVQLVFISWIFGFSHSIWDSLIIIAPVRPFHTPHAIDHFQCRHRGRDPDIIAYVESIADCARRLFSRPKESVPFSFAIAGAVRPTCWCAVEGTLISSQVAIRDAFVPIRIERFSFWPCWSRPQIVDQCRNTW